MRYRYVMAISPFSNRIIPNWLLYSKSPEQWRIGNNTGDAPERQLRNTYSPGFPPILFQRVWIHFPCVGIPLKPPWDYAPIVWQFLPSVSIVTGENEMYPTILSSPSATIELTSVLLSCKAPIKSAAARVISAASCTLRI